MHVALSAGCVQASWAVTISVARLLFGYSQDPLDVSPQLDASVQHERYRSWPLPLEVAIAWRCMVQAWMWLWMQWWGGWLLCARLAQQEDR
jgi:hypothetical protein